MSACPFCGHRLTRVHRTWLERIFYTAVFHCATCNKPYKRLRSVFDVQSIMNVSRQTRCVSCLSTQVERTSRAPRVGLVANHLSSLLLHLAGAPTYRCRTCGTVYSDWRSLPPSHVNGAAPTAASDVSSGETRIPSAVFSGRTPR